MNQQKRYIDRVYEQTVLETGTWLHKYKNSNENYCCPLGVLKSTNVVYHLLAQDCVVIAERKIGLEATMSVVAKAYLKAWQWEPHKTTRLKYAEFLTVAWHEGFWQGYRMHKTLERTKQHYEGQKDEKV